MNADVAEWQSIPGEDTFAILEADWLTKAYL
jgi:hypothetical protein